MSGVCRYYLQGNCRYGSRCRFRHEDPYDDYSNQNQYYWSNNSYSGGSYRSNGNSHRSTNYNNNQRNNTNREQSDDLEFAIAVQKEVVAFVGGKQWPLTCFAPMREKSCVPGWMDHSPEEIRWEMYKAVKDGTVEECKLRIHQLYKEAQERTRDFSYQDNAMAIIGSLKQKNDDWGNSSNSLGSSNVFQNQNSAFGTSNANSNVFFQNSATATSSSYFNQTSPDPGRNNVFGVPFGSSSQQSTPFGVAQQAATLPSTNRSFYDPNPSFTFSLNQNTFSSNNPGANQNTFGSNNPAAIASTNQNFQTATGFGNNPVNNYSSGTPFQSPQVVVEANDSSIFSSLSDLTENEIEMFKAATFKFGQVPLKPPSKDLCEMCS